MGGDDLQNDVERISTQLELGISSDDGFVSDAGFGGHIAEGAETGPRDMTLVPHGAHYCTAHGYECKQPLDMHDTHTRVTPHERRNGVLAADGVVAMICAFFAVDALSTLDGLTFADPDWVGGECPHLCDPSALVATWTADNYEFNSFKFDAAAAGKSAELVDTPEGEACLTASEKYQNEYFYHTIGLATVAVAGLICAIQNALVMASGSYLLYDAKEKTVEQKLIQRFDGWWASTTCCRFIFSRVMFIVTGLAYLWALGTHPAIICHDDPNNFGDSTDKLKIIGWCGMAALFLLYAMQKILEKCCIFLPKAGNESCRKGITSCVLGAKSKKRDSVTGKHTRADSWSLCYLLQFQCCYNCCKGKEGEWCHTWNPCTSFFGCLCSLFCDYNDCACCGHEGDDRGIVKYFDKKCGDHGEDHSTDRDGDRDRDRDRARDRARDRDRDRARARAAASHDDDDHKDTLHDTITVDDDNL